MSSVASPAGLIHLGMDTSKNTIVVGGGGGAAADRPVRRTAGAALLV